MRSAVAVAVVIIAGLLTPTARAGEGTPCPTWEPCGPSGVRCLYRGRELEASDPACAAQFLDAACAAGSGGGCFERARQDLEHGDRSARTWARLAGGLVRDVVQQPARLWDGPVPVGLLGLFLVEALAFSLWRRERPLRASAQLGACSLVPVAVGLSAIELVDWLGLLVACAAVAVVHPWMAPRAIAPPPTRRARVLLGIGAALALAVLVILAVLAPLPPLPALGEGLWSDGVEVLAVAAAGWLAMVVPKTIAARLVGVPSLGRALGVTLLASLASLAPGALAAFWIGEWLARTNDAVAFAAMLAGAFAVSALVESRVHRRRQSAPRPVRAAVLSNLCAWLLVGAALFVYARLR